MVSHNRLPSSSSYDLPAIASSAPPAPASTHRASSVTSGRSHTRRHRHARTHYSGSSSSSSQNEFPVFSHTGDVEIVISSANGRKENRYLLHRLILSQCSGFFEAGTRAEWSARVIDNGASGGSLARINGNDNATIGSSSRTSSQERRPSFDQPGRWRWKYALDWRAASDDEAPMLVQKDSSPPSLFGGGPPPVRNKPPASNESFFRNVTNFSSLSLNERPQPSAPAESDDEILKDYDNLFRTMYQYPPILDSVNIATAYTECKALLRLADMYDALEIVGSRVDHHLLRFGARLFKQIAKYPPSYLKLGYLARSRTIFTEALIHVVGQWPLAAAQLRGQIDSAVMELIEDKVDELQELEERIEAKLWKLMLTTSRGERITPSIDYLSWLAMSLFRQWVAENTTPPPTSILKDPGRQGSNTTTSQVAARSSSRSNSNHIASQRVHAPPPPPVPPSPGRMYRLIGSPSPTAYLAHDELKRFLKLSPDLYTRENLKRFERRMDEVKNLARDAVRPLMRNFLELDLSIFGGPLGLGYLTCTRVEELDLPWDD
ncbi:hypothetical protein B0A50_00267 [Salinomyces thailandicus]|uniref:BTB domain-containing protein n=1 Tax=Salinomyces thailandicus TaxID=706561 RepID=A0A4U0UG18_9PEZI|nr:hypothetical protein B0A50_00267 [Salinomyces thailandica]